MDKRGKAAFFSDDDFVIEEPTVDIPLEEEKKPENKVAKKKPGGNPLENMLERKEIRKNCGFTLSPDSIQKLEKLARQNKCSKSMALDLLIQKYL